MLTFHSGTVANLSLVFINRLVLCAYIIACYNSLSAYTLLASVASSVQLLMSIINLYLNKINTHTHTHTYCLSSCMLPVPHRDVNRT